MTNKQITMLNNPPSETYPPKEYPDTEMVSPHNEDTTVAQQPTQIIDEAFPLLQAKEQITRELATKSDTGRIRLVFGGS